MTVTDLKNASDKEKHSEDLKFPKSVFFITTNELCERFCYYGMRTVLSIYLTDYLFYTESDATIIYHTFIMLAYFFPLIGAIIADSYWGKFNTIFYVSMIYAFGNIILSLSAITPLNLPHREFSLIGLLCIAIGTGGIKPCVASFGADQFILPQQEKLLGPFYSVFYFAINLGSLFSTILTPLLREDVHCFGEETCFPLAFGVPAGLMIAAIVIIATGKPFYRCVPPEDNLIIKAVKCGGIAVKRKITSKTKEKHWLDYASNKFSDKFIEDLKQSLKVLLMFVTFPVFWTLCDQTGSAWTFQARRMYNDLGFYRVPPDQMQLLGPFVYMLLIPAFHYLFYPIFDKFNILQSLLAKVAAGGFITALSFVATGCVSLALESTNPEQPSGNVAHLRVYNTLPCDAVIYCPGLNSTSFSIKQGACYDNLSLLGNLSLPYTLSSTCADISGKFETLEGTAVGYYFQNGIDHKFLDDVLRHSEAFSRIRTLVNTNGYPNVVNVTYTSSFGSIPISTNSSDPNLYDVSAGTYEIRIGSYEFETRFSSGGVYAVLASATNSPDFEVEVVEITAPNSINILWLVPQYVLLTIGELLLVREHVCFRGSIRADMVAMVSMVFYQSKSFPPYHHVYCHGELFFYICSRTIFNIPGMEFAYSQAPVSMKSVVVAAWLLTTAVGNLLVVLIEAASIFQLASNNFFLYAVLMFLDMVIFTIMARRYKYIQVEDSPKL